MIKKGVFEMISNLNLNLKNVGLINNAEINLML